MTDDTQARATTNDAGIAAPSNEFSLSPGADGPLLLEDYYLIQQMARFSRERVPEHVVHSKGRGAHGFSEATKDVSQLLSASLVDHRPAFRRRRT